MKLSCPICAVCFKVDAQLISPLGRKVKCTACGHIWMASKENNFSSFLANENIKNTPESTVFLQKKEKTLSDQPEKKFQRTASPLLNEKENTFNKQIGENNTNEIEKKREKELQNKRKKVLYKNYIKFSLVGFICFLIIGLTLLFFIKKNYIVNVWPAAKGIYHFIGLNTDISGQGLVIEDITYNLHHTKKGEKLRIQGIIINKTSQIRLIPRIKIKFTTENTIDEKTIIYKIAKKTIQSGEKVDFYIDLPPHTAISSKDQLIFVNDQDEK